MKSNTTTNNNNLVQHVEELPILQLSSDEGNLCTICQQNLRIGEVVRTLPCFHMYHKYCIDSWLAQNLTCPTCLVQVLIPSAIPYNLTNPFQVEGIPVENLTLAKCRGCNNEFIRDEQCKPSTSSYYRCARCREADFGKCMCNIL